jgi:arylsulfatase A-like enzyme
MTRSLSPAALAVAAMLPAWGAVAALSAGESARPPNVLMVVADDLGYADVGFHGCTDIPTPHLDALAASGVRFTNAYVTCPVCSPTRSALLSGRYQTSYGHEFNPLAANQGLPAKTPCLAERLKASGYATGCFGKWHLGKASNLVPTARGFDAFFGFLGGGHSYIQATDLQRGREKVRTISYLTDDLGDAATAFVEQNREKPWFVYLAFNAVHTPMHAPGDRLKRLPPLATGADAKASALRRDYAAMLLALDDNVGKVMAKLAETGQTQHTMVCFFSDNGGPNEMVEASMNGSSNAPLRGSKCMLLEGGIRVPFVISWPGRLKPGVYEQPVLQIDLHPTALAVAGPVRPEWTTDGVDLMPHLEGRASGAPHDALYWRFGRQMAIRKGDLKLVRTIDSPSGPALPPALYDLSTDLGETKDLSAARPDAVQDLQADWDAWNATQAKPAWINDFGLGVDSEADEAGKPKSRKP